MNPVSPLLGGLAFLIAATSHPCLAQPLRVATIAGKSSLLPKDGEAPPAYYYWATGIHADRHGNTYVADSFRIVKISPDGGAVTVAGNFWSGGTEDGPAAQATFGYIRAVAVDSFGTVFVADEGNHTIRKISVDGMVSTFAGKAGEPGHADGRWDEARFNLPRGLWIDGADVLYVSDQSFPSSEPVGWIRKIDPSGNVTTLAVNLKLQTPEGLAMDPSGNLVVADYYAATIYKVAPDGSATVLVSNAENATGVAADPEGNLYFTQTTSFMVRKRSSSGALSTIAGGVRGVLDGAGMEARFFQPRGVARLPDGNLVVADGSSIRKVTPQGEVTTLSGTPGGASDGPVDQARFFEPAGLASDSSGNLYVADSGNHTIRKISASGQVMTFAGKAGQPGSADGLGSQARFSSPSDLVLDGQGNLYVTDKNNSAIRKISPQGQVSKFATSVGSHLAMDPTGTIYIGERTRISRLTSAGSISALAGGSSSGYADGMGSQALFNNINGIALDGLGNLYVADTSNYVIRKVSPEGQVSTVAGKARTRGRSDGPALEAAFFFPRDVAVNPAGTLYVADALVIRQVKDGVVSTVAGHAGEFGEADGEGEEARFGWDRLSLSWDLNGVLYIADFRGNSIRQAVPSSEGPRLNHALSNGSIIFSWPLWATEFILESAPVPSGSWSQVPLAPSTNATEFSFVFEPEEPAKFYRLHRP